jgi:hypothetical protein
LDDEEENMEEEECAALGTKSGALPLCSVSLSFSLFLCSVAADDDDDVTVDEDEDDDEVRMGLSCDDAGDLPFFKKDIHDDMDALERKMGYMVL